MATVPTSGREALEVLVRLLLLSRVEGVARLLLLLRKFKRSHVARTSNLLDLSTLSSSYTLTFSLRALATKHSLSLGRIHTGRGMSETTAFPVRVFPTVASITVVIRTLLLVVLLSASIGSNSKVSTTGVLVVVLLHVLLLLVLLKLLLLEVRVHARHLVAPHVVVRVLHRSHVVRLLVNRCRSLGYRRTRMPVIALLPSSTPTLLQFV
mmetsp:Transcript_8821/g.23883  ORF Transcript_8821/g.23883 Transcript_8821/m.23883 type:complete len:209 (+) Transcript_8821:274-900(+)